MRYRTAKQLLEERSTVLGVMLAKNNYFIRTGIIQKLVHENINKTGEILEVGCGNGDLAKELLGDGYKNIKLVDLDNYLRDKNILPVHLTNVCFNPLPFEDESLDAVLAIAIIEHLENALLFIREVNRVLKKGGKFFIAVPSIFSLKSRLTFLFKGDLAGYRETNDHITLFTRSIFKKVVLKDFRKLQEFYSKGYISLFGKKLRMPRPNAFYDKLFGDKVLFLLEKK